MAWTMDSIYHFGSRTIVTILHLPFEVIGRMSALSQSRVISRLPMKRIGTNGFQLSRNKDVPKMKEFLQLPESALTSGKKRAKPPRNMKTIGLSIRFIKETPTHFVHLEASSKITSHLPFFSRNCPIRATKLHNVKYHNPGR
jgi:hypothetical protein